ncbi:MAG TPA: SPOR domain-containing protein [Blastocatellia bacterium]|nr:SPOR domain-containing protein [Blastocatellia bacterium]
MLLLLIGVASSVRIAYSQTRYYAVQVAALRSEECAAELVKGFRARKLDAYVVKVEVPKAGTFYRIRVGKFTTMEVARAFAEKLLNSGLVESLGIAVTDFEPPQNDALKIAVKSQSDLPAGVPNTPIPLACPIAPSNSNSTTASPVTAINTGSSNSSPSPAPKRAAGSQTAEDYIAALGMSQKGQANKNQKPMDGKTIVAKMPPMSAPAPVPVSSSGNVVAKAAPPVATAPATPAAAPSSAAVAKQTPPPTPAAPAPVVAKQTPPTTAAASVSSSLVARQAPESSSGNVAYKASATPATPANDVILMMRSIDQTQWRLKSDLNLVARSIAPPRQPVDIAAAKNKQAIDAVANNINSVLGSSLNPANLAKTTASAETTIASNASPSPAPASPRPVESRPVERTTAPQAAAAPAPRPVTPATVAAAAPAPRPVAPAPRAAVPPTTASSSTLAAVSDRPVAEIRGPNVRRGGALLDDEPLTPIKLQGIIELRNGQLQMRVKNLDLRRAFSGVARMSVSDDRNSSDLSPVQVVLQPEEEVTLPINESFPYGEAMLLVYDEKQAVQLIRSAPFGQRPASATPPRQQQTQTQQDDDPNGGWTLTVPPQPDNAAGNPVPNNALPNNPPVNAVPNNPPVNNAPANPQYGLPNVTGVYDARGGAAPPQTSAPQAGGNNSGPAPGINGGDYLNKSFENDPVPNGGPISLNPRQMGATADNVAMEVNVAAVRAPGYVTLKLQAGDYQDEKSWVMSSLNDKVPFLVPAKAAKGGYNLQVIDEQGRLLAKSSGNFLQVGR